MRYTAPSGVKENSRRRLCLRPIRHIRRLRPQLTFSSAYYETYRLPVVIVRPSNNYGYYQFPEKFIPLMITNLLMKKPIPIYGKGENVRDWCFVEDTCAAIDNVMHNGKAGEVYNAGGNCEVENIELAKSILKIMGKSERHIKFVKDRPGHDYRYALDNSKNKT